MWSEVHTELLNPKMYQLYFEPLTGSFNSILVHLTLFCGGGGEELAKPNILKKGAKVDDLVYSDHVLTWKKII